MGMHPIPNFVFAFPQWYSLVMFPWLALQVYFFVTIKVSSRLAVDRAAA